MAVEMHSSRGAGNVLVILQVASLLVIAFHALPALRAVPSAIVIGCAAAFSLWAVTGMGRGTFRVHPRPSHRGKLQTTGAYRLVRHPMYAAVLAASLAVVWMAPTIAATAALAVLCVVLHFKARIEEAALREKYPGYGPYARRVPALVPFLPRRHRRAAAVVVAAVVAAPTLWLPVEAQWDQRLFATGDDAAVICRNVGVQEARMLLANRAGLVPLDVRSGFEASGKRLPGARHIASGNESFGEEAGRLGKETPLLVYCAGGFRSRMAVATLRQSGFREVYHLHRGILSWRLCGGDVGKSPEVVEVPVTQGQ